MHKKATLVAAVLVGLALFLAVPAWPGTIPTSLVPEGARWIAHLDMEKFVATDLYGYLEKDGKFQIKSRDLDRWLKMDVPKDIKGVTVFGLGPGDEQIVFAVSGKFDKAGILALVALERSTRRRPTAPIPSTRPGATSTARSSTTTSSSSPRAARRSRRSSTRPAARPRPSPDPARRLAQGRARGRLPQRRFGRPLRPGQGDRPVQARREGRGLFFLAQEKDNLLQLRLQMTADSPENAKNIADLVQGVMALGRLGGGEGDMAGIATLVDGIQVKLDGKTVRLEFDGASQDIAKLLSSGTASH